MRRLSRPRRGKETRVGAAEAARQTKQKHTNHGDARRRRPRRHPRANSEALVRRLAVRGLLPVVWVILLFTRTIRRPTPKNVVGLRTRLVHKYQSPPPEAPPRCPLGWLVAVMRSWPDETFLRYSGVDGLVIIYFLRFAS